jgi:hypothetical protein
MIFFSHVCLCTPICHRLHRRRIRCSSTSTSLASRGPDPLLLESDIMSPVPFMIHIRVISPFLLNHSFQTVDCSVVAWLDRQCHSLRRPSLSPFSSSSRLIWPKNPLILDNHIDALLTESPSPLLSPLKPPNMPWSWLSPMVVVVFCCVWYSRICWFFGAKKSHRLKLIKRAALHRTFLHTTVGWW